VTAINRGDVFDAEVPGLGRRPAVVVTRQVAIPFLANVIVAMVTATIRGLPTEIPLEREQGLDHESVANCDNLYTVPKSALGRLLGRLGPEQLERLDAALRVALGVD
jgi:mRNA interferase MazF